MSAFVRESKTDWEHVRTREERASTGRYSGPKQVHLGDSDSFDEQASRFDRDVGSILVRITSGRDFVNHLYVDLDGVPARAIVSYNRDSGSVTVSLADPIPGVSCREILQGMWGPEAGGHDGIARSPREADLGLTGFWQAVGAVSRALGESA